jgi:hypothetical protein
MRIINATLQPDVKEEEAKNVVMVAAKLVDSVGITLVTRIINAIRIVLHVLHSSSNNNNEELSSHPMWKIQQQLQHQLQQQ